MAAGLRRGIEEQNRVFCPLDEAERRQLQDLRPRCAGGKTDTMPAVTHARARAETYLLERRMLRSLTSGQAIDRRWMRFSFPTMWHYDVLRGLDYLRSAGARPDERVAEAIKLVEKRRHQNGRWRSTAFIPIGPPSTWKPG